MLTQASTDLSMSTTVSVAIDAAVSAPISTPAAATHRSELVMRTSAATPRSRRSIEVAERQQVGRAGISSGVRLAAMIPAICATVSTSPLGDPRRSASTVAGELYRTRVSAPEAA
jgi:hypothetical protein